jgi:hypothetical protein
MKALNVQGKLNRSSVSNVSKGFLLNIEENFNLYINNKNIHNGQHQQVTSDLRDSIIKHNNAVFLVLNQLLLCLLFNNTPAQFRQ